jgi:hypothetical protein
MEQSSSGSTNSDPNKINNSAAEGDVRSSEAHEPPNQRMVADRLLAALTSGNLEHLSQARRAFLKQPPADRKREPRPPSSMPSPADEMVPAKHTAADVTGSVERGSASRRAAQDFLPVAELQRIEDELRQAEAELDRRRAEVAAAKQNAEDEARRRAFDESRRELEAATRKRAAEEEQRLAALQSLRDQAEVAAREREYQQRELNAAIQTL